jgi:urea transporter/murein DD-endopeptidase MepM/ murein hydrolase activator NlpD
MAALIATVPAARARIALAAEDFLRAYAQILFSRSPAVGLLLLMATATVPRALVAGAVAVLSATLAARLLNLDDDVIKSGAYSYNALLVGLGVGQTFSGRAEVALVIILASASSVVITAALRSWAGAGSHLPVLTLPFLAVFYLTLGASAFLGLSHASPASDPSALALYLPEPLVIFVRSLGSLFFLPRLDAGALILAALIVHSRIAASLSAFAFTVVWALHGHVLSLPDGAMAGVLGDNAVLTAVSLGAVWFVPSTSSFLLSLFGTLLTSLVTMGLFAPLGRLGVPALILPFNLTVLSMLFAMRQRARDERPKSVDFLSGTPEENLTYVRTRLARFQWLYPIAFRAPFRGRWVCTQGENGALTHQGIWKHAFDFEVRDEEGRLYRDTGTSPDHYHCFRLPVLATADGTVVDVENDVADNAIGDNNLEKNWGNLVLLYHAPGLYSLVAHLAKGSVKVVKGQIVRRGDVLGLCGNSGRSPQPHIHFQLQSTHLLGAATLPCKLHDVVVEGDVKASFAPAEGDALRNLEPDDDLAAYFGFTPGQTWAFQDGKSVERLTAEIDLHGRLLLRAEARPSTLFYGKTDEHFTAYDVIGEPDSLLHRVRAALPRVPFDAAPGLSWTDTLPARYFRGWASRALWDVLSPFLPHDGIAMDLRLRREGLRLVVEGASKRRDRRGEPLLKTRAELLRGAGLMQLQVTVRGKTRAVSRVDDGLTISVMKEDES